MLILLAISALMSEVDVNGEKHVLLCRVILGKCEKVEAGSQQRFPSSVDFDSGADDLENPRWYVVWCNNMNTHVLPEVVVSYKPANNAQGMNSYLIVFPLYVLYFDTVYYIYIYIIFSLVKLVALFLPFRTIHWRLIC